MADHVREQIRSRIVTNVTGLGTTGSRVFESEFIPWNQVNFLDCWFTPFLKVQNPSELDQTD